MYQKVCRRWRRPASTPEIKHLAARSSRPAQTPRLLEKRRNDLAATPPGRNPGACKPSQTHCAPTLFDSILGDERDHRVGGDADVERGEACIEAQRATLRHDLGRAIQGVFVLKLSRD